MEKRAPSQPLTFLAILPIMSMCEHIYVVLDHLWTAQPTRIL